MDKFLVLLKYSNSKDCIMKTLQNGALFLSHFVKNKNNNKLYNLYNIILDSRRTMSLFNFLQDIHSIKINYKNKLLGNDNRLYKLNRNENILSLLETIFENYDFYISKKILNGNEKIFTKLYSIFWIGDILYIINQKCYNIYSINNNKDKDKNKKNEKLMNYIGIFSYIMDLPMAFNCAGLIQPIFHKNFSRGFYGLTGMFAGASRLYILNNNKIKNE